MKKVLIVATVFKFLNFEINDLKILKDMGFEIHVASNMFGVDWLKDDGSLDYLDIIKHQIDFGRTPLSFGNIKALMQLKKLLKKEHYDLIHCHTPIAAALIRIAANKYRKRGNLKVIYTSHGFHFHKHSSKKSWLIYHTLEKRLAPKTDMIITINREDLEVVKNFSVKEKRYIPGVGIDINKIESAKGDENSLRQELNIPLDSFVIMSIGELSERKNQIAIIKALSKMEFQDIYYLLCGTGTKEKELKKLVKKLELGERVLFLGHRDHDWVMSLAHAIDVGAIPSKIEGLGLAGLEMMAAGKPIIGSCIHGINDYVINGVTGFSCYPDDIDGFAKSIGILYKDRELRAQMGQAAKEKASEFDINIVHDLMTDNYRYILNSD